MLKQFVFAFLLTVSGWSYESNTHPENLPERYTEAFIQDTQSKVLDNKLYVVLDNHTGWVVYRIYGNSEKWWKWIEDAKDIDQRLVCNPLGWREGDEVHIYSFPYQKSLAKRILRDGNTHLRSASHLFFNSNRKEMAFARRLTRSEIERKDLKLRPIKIIPNRGLKTKLSSIVGAEKAKAEVSDLIRCLKDPKPYLRLGAELPQGLFISGPPGCGKTLFAKALAKESGRNLIQISGDRFWDEIFFKNESWIEPLFDAAREQAPCVILVDGFDTFDFLRHFVIYHFLVTRLKREIELMGGEQDLFLVITARDIQNMGQHFLSSNRACQILHVDYPSKKERIELLTLYSKGFKLDAKCDLEALAFLTLSFSPTDLKEIFHLGARSAAAKKQETIHQIDLELGAKRVAKANAEQSKGPDSPAKLSDPFGKKVTFSDVGGCHEAKEELAELVSFLKDPAQFSKLGARAPKGILCVGPPGCGKTLLARAVAGEAGCNFFHCSGSDFQDKWVGSGVSRVREVFQTAKANAPAILFIDEIDAVGGKRLSDPQAAAREFNSTLNQILIELDGFDSAEGLLVMGATNLPKLLDEALLRSGRFDRQIVISTPCLPERFEILKIHSKNLPLAETIDLDHTARMTTGLSGADLANLLNEAALIAGREEAQKIGSKHLREAFDKIQLGRERKSLKISEKEKRHTAYHEAGHTIVGLVLDTGTEVDKVTIMPRGVALGITHFVPKGENVSFWKQQAINTLAQSLGGLAAEKFFIGDTSSGVSSDLKHATQLAKQMVAHWGMSDELGLAAFGNDLSEETRRLVDVEVKKLLDRAYALAAKIIEDYQAQIEQIVTGLLEKETLYRSDLLAIMEPLPYEEA